MGWRDITNATNERTVIASVFPKVGTNHKVPLFHLGAHAARSAAFLAMITSLPFDYVARQKIGGTSLTYFYLKQFPALLPWAFTEADLTFITPRVLELTYTSHAMRPWAEDLGHYGPPFAWDGPRVGEGSGPFAGQNGVGAPFPKTSGKSPTGLEDRRAQLRAELDAFFALKYGLSRDELVYVLDPAKARGPGYPSETFRVLQKNEIARFGEYRTERLVLAAFDRLTGA
jgi:hypothetical protein